MKLCDLPGCEGRSVARGFCASHYSRWAKHGEGFNRAPVARKSGKKTGCVIDGCGREHYCYFLCRTHYSTCNSYGLTSVQLQELYLGGCGVCSDPYDLHVDHDHSCCPVGNQKKCGLCVRGILCRRCNMALGGFQDSALVLSWAIEYLRGNGYKRLVN